MQKVVPFLWYESQAEEAANLYVSVIPDSRIVEVNRQGDRAFTVTFELGGVRYIALNGGPHDRFNDSISLFVNCRDQAEVDAIWAKLTADGGQEVQCGWLKDKFGVSWQIIPTAMMEMLGDGQHPEKAARAQQAMMQMTKIDLAAMRKAYEGT